MLSEELRRLKGVERPAISAAIGRAREHGDISENAEYDAAKEKQAHDRGAHPPDRGPPRARRGRRDRRPRRPTWCASAPRSCSRISTTGDEVTYRIVGEDEADVSRDCSR